MTDDGPAPDDPGRSRAPEAIRALHPGSFALVMATGIVSIATDHLGLHRTSAVLLVAAAVCWALLVVAYVWRAIACRARFLADLRAPSTAFAFFTAVAACGVLANRLLLDRHQTAAITLGALALGAWVALSYAVPLRIIAGPRTDGVLHMANGTWLLWVVATQSLSTVASGLVPVWPSRADGMTLLAVASWGVGAVLYVVLICVVLLRLLLFGVQLADLTGPYWISMGATAITVLAGDRLLRLSATPVLTEVRPIVVGTCLVLWAFGTWLWPPLVAQSLRRATVRRPIGTLYRVTDWSVVFPIGMYSVASIELSRIVGAPWIGTIGKAAGWLALAAWLFTAVLLIVGLMRRLPARSEPVSAV